VITGAMDDWLYDAHGQLAWTVELWSPHRQAGIEDYDYIDWYREHPPEDDLKLLQWNDSELQGQACVDWYPYEHPQLGEVALGGWNVLFSFWNPPPDKLAQEVARLPEWLLWHALITPRLEWLHCDVTRMDDDVYQIDAAVVNSGWLPTQVSQHALKQNLFGRQDLQVGDCGIGNRHTDRGPRGPYGRGRRYRGTGEDRWNRIPRSAPPGCWRRTR